MIEVAPGAYEVREQMPHLATAISLNTPLLLFGPTPKAEMIRLIVQLSHETGSWTGGGRAWIGISWDHLYERAEPRYSSLWKDSPQIHGVIPEEHFIETGVVFLRRAINELATTGFLARVTIPPGAKTKAVDVFFPTPKLVEELFKKQR